MSRCFPFPPPGYEKKSSTDETDLLKKEKRKEKKHKKDKKDKEKREGKEKREKDRSDGKHKEKKDRKEKHMDKKKDKEKGQCSTSDEKRAGEQFEGYNREKLNKKADPLKDKSSCSDDKKSAVQYWRENGELPVVPNTMLAKDTEAKFVQELGRRIRDEEKGTRSNHFVEEFITHRKKDDGVNRFAVGDIGMVAKSKNNNNNRVESSKMDGQKIRDEANFSGNAMVPNSNFTGMAENKFEGKVALLDKKIDRRIEEKEKSREREGDDKRREKRKNKDKDKKSQGKEKDREKEKKKEEKAKEKSEHKKAEKDKSKHINKSDPVSGVNSNMPFHPTKDHIQNPGTEENLKKRKEMETNGFSLDNEPRPNKIPRPNSHVLLENGRKLEASQIPDMFLSGRQVASSNNFKVIENKEQKLNSCVTAQSVSVSTKKPLLPTTANHSAAKLLPVSTIKPLPANADQIKVQPLPVISPPKTSSVDPHLIAPQPLPVHSKTKPFPSIASQIAEPSMKPKMGPHPDTKYLSQILSVPKMEPWSDFDDQEWLFSSKDPPLKRVKEEMEFEQDNEERQVWAEALHIESVDVCALPYVIPY